MADVSNPLTLRSQPEAEHGTAIEIRNVGKTFRIFHDRRTNLKELFTDRRRRDRTSSFWAVKDVSLDIPRGKTFGLIGHNGSGKSTLLKMVAGIHRPSEGTIVTHGRVTAMLELGAGFHPELSGRENIFLNGSILGMSRKQVTEAMDRIIEFSGLGEFIDTPVKVYSSGMYVRLGFAIAVNLDPEILVIDEVIAVGDEEFQRKCFDHLYELRRKGVTIIVVSHALGLMAELCDEVAWLDHGVLQAVGPARELTDAYLASVNRKEAESNEGASNEFEDEVAEQGRWGSGEIKVTGVDYLDGSGKAVPFLTTGEPATLEVHYESTFATEKAAFGISIDHESGFHVADVNSGNQPQRGDPVVHGTGSLRFSVDELPLMPGNYDVTTMVSEQKKIYDCRERAFQLRVRTGDSSIGGGVVRMVGAWTEPSPRPAARPRLSPGGPEDGAGDDSVAGPAEDPPQ